MRLERSVACISVSIHYEMVNLMVAVNTKRKDSELAGHGFFIFLDSNVRNRTLTLIEREDDTRS
jgi:hypothetical protein